MSITMVKVRAKITIGGLVVETPYIQSFNVSVVRGQISTFSAQFKVPYNEVRGNIVGQDITIDAGRGSPSNRIFAGLVKRAKISPVFDDPDYVLMSVSGEDIISLLNGKKYTRRCRATTATWVTIDNVVRKGLRTGKFKALRSSATTIVPTSPFDIDSNTGLVNTTPTDLFETCTQNTSMESKPQGLNVVTQIQSDQG